MNARLLSPIAIGAVTLPNRIVVAPMCQYSADDGSAGDWHLQHLMSMAMSGAGLVVVEATAVERRGRITHGCLGLYSDHNEAALGRAIDAARRVAPAGTKFAIQLAHAGRKAASTRPWEGDRALEPGEDPWPIVGPSAIAFGPGRQEPEALDEAGIGRTVDAFAAAAVRAARIGFDAVELHCAHGYLLHSFLSPIANWRTDAYGGTADARMRMPLDVLAAVRARLPSGIAVGARITGSDWIDGGLTPADAVAFARALKDGGAHYVCVSSGGIVPNLAIRLSPGYQVPFAETVKAGSGLVTRAVGLVTTPEQAEAIVAEGRADLVAFARAMLADPRWGVRAAAALGGRTELPPPYRAASRLLVSS